MSEMTPKEVLKIVADRYEGGQWQWIQHRLDNGNGGFCLAGAIREVAQGNWELRYGAGDALRPHLPIEPHWPIAYYNDADGRRLEDVIAVLRKASE